MDILNEEILRAKELMGLITEQIPGMEDAFNKEVKKMYSQNIEGRFGMENFMKLKSLVEDKWGMTQVNNLQDDNSFYMWSKDIDTWQGITGNEKLIVFLGNRYRDKPEAANIWVYADQKGGEGTGGDNGMPNPPVEDSWAGVSGQFTWQGFNKIEPQMQRVEKVFN